MFKDIAKATLEYLNACIYAKSAIYPITPINNIRPTTFKSIVAITAHVNGRNINIVDILRKNNNEFADTPVFSTIL